MGLGRAWNLRNGPEAPCSFKERGPHKWEATGGRAPLIPWGCRVRGREHIPTGREKKTPGLAPTALKLHKFCVLTHEAT